jgi:hypothetical protein
MQTLSVGGREGEEKKMFLKSITKVQIFIVQKFFKLRNTCFFLFIRYLYNIFY